MTNVNLIALDMDGVVNSNELILDWLYRHRDELIEEYKDQADEEVKKLFKYTFKNGRELVFPQLAEKVTRLCRETDSYILWSTDWRRIDPYVNSTEAILTLFRKFDLPTDRFLGCTPVFNSSRGTEINAWIESNKFFSYKDLHRCAVLDDLLEAGIGLSEKCKLFKTDPNIGITEQIVENAKRFLLEEDD